VDEQGEQLLAARRQLPERLSQGGVPFGREQVLPGCLGVIVGDGPGGQRMPRVAGMPGRARDAAAFAFLARVTRPVTTGSVRPRLACWVRAGFVAMAFS
jgi:hypothetical protein